MLQWCLGGADLLFWSEIRSFLVILYNFLEHQFAYQESFYLLNQTHQESLLHQMISIKTLETLPQSQVTILLLSALDYYAHCSL